MNVYLFFRRFLCVIFFLFTVPFYTKSHAQDNQGYWLLEDYLEMHPEQVKISDRFVSRVRSTALAFSKHQQDSTKVLIVYPGLQVSDYWRRSVASFEGRMRELNIDYELSSHFTKAGSDIELQGKLLGQSRGNPPDFLIFTLDATRHKGMIDRIISTDETQVILQNITSPIKAFEKKQPLLYVGFDHGIGARILAERYKSEYPAGANYAILYGTQGYVSSLRGDVFYHEMSQHLNSKLLGSYYVDFDREKAYRATLELLREHPDLDFIYACSTDIAIGAIDALKETGRLRQVKVNGWGGGSEELSAIEKGLMDFTVMRMNDDNGVAMAEAIKSVLEGKEAHVPVVFSGDFRTVDQETTSERLLLWRSDAFRYSD
ncbi:substrate-binding domain-containing protein [Kiloniella antarctica]|uniref:Substrate-binding domain-containing protein n=1 Tax=Kiloniella antarctica TaxID=1550907 RepID=A0ABW5BI02_9PROT